MGSSPGVDRHAHNMIEINETFPLSLPLIPFDLHDPNSNIFHKQLNQSFSEGKERDPHWSAGSPILYPNELHFSRANDGMRRLIASRSFQIFTADFIYNRYPLVNIQKKLLKMAIEIVDFPDFPIKNGGSFHGKMVVHQRVCLLISLFSAIVWGKFNGPAQEELFFTCVVSIIGAVCSEQMIPFLSRIWINGYQKAHQTMTCSILFPMFFCKTTDWCFQVSSCFFDVFLPIFPSKSHGELSTPWRRTPAVPRISRRCCTVLGRKQGAEPAGEAQQLGISLGFHMENGGLMGLIIGKTIGNRWFHGV